MRILVVEDDETIANVIATGLREAKHEVEISLDGQSGAQRLEEQSFDLVVLDLMLPKKNGLEIVAEMRARNLETKVLILSAKRSVDERVLGLRSGGDDYLTKPFAFSELMARCEVLLRRLNPSINPGSVSTLLNYSDLSIDLISREVKRGARALELQAKEFILLEYLVRNADQVVSKTQILETVWKYNFDPQTNVVDVLVHRLRVKVDLDSEPKLIHTIRGVGYVLKQTL